jgi:hypothetical protein
MKSKTLSLVLLSVISIIVFVSGCTGLDPTAIAKGNAMIKQFLNEHPNAKIVTTHFSTEQSANIIDQIRRDCDSPYINQKEFYRVTITDPDTNFYAVVWVDWKTQTVECAYKVGTEGNKTVDKPPQPGCGSHTTYKCDSGHLYWYDSCGNMQEKKEYCQNGCSENKCIECTSHATYKCSENHVYWFDSCGNKQEKKEYCQYGCFGDACSSQLNQTCTQGQTKSCGASNIGICKYGTQTCTNGNWGPCAGSVNATTEICGNKLDDDCDGQVDENCQNSCSDSDSNSGNPYFVKGTVGFCSMNNDCLSKADSCQDNSNLTEVYCKENGEIGYETYSCPWGCSSGACIIPPGCVDSDASLDYYTKGAVTISTNQTFTDYCACEPKTSLCSNDGLWEWYCENGGRRSIYYECPFGCSNGACSHSTQACTETDGGFNINVTGTTTGPEIETGNIVSKTDYCNENGYLVEYFCNNTDPGYIPGYVHHDLRYCPNGCSNGACNMMPIVPCGINTPCTLTRGQSGSTYINQNSYTITFIDANPTEALLNVSGTMRVIEKGAVCKTVAGGMSIPISVTDLVYSETSPTVTIVPCYCTGTSCEHLNELSYGSATFGLQTFTDSCKDNETVTEYCCFEDGGGMDGVHETTCPSGYHCWGGVCIS